MIKTKTETEKTQAKLLKRFHTLCGVVGLSKQDKKAILDGYGYTSSTQLTIKDLVEVNEKLSQTSTSRNQELNAWRKRLMASIGNYLRENDKPENADYIKRIACRASTYDNFNEIPKHILIKLYNQFNNKGLDLDYLNSLFK